MLIDFLEGVSNEHFISDTRFIVADASDQTPGKSCLGIATAESAVGGAAIGWGAGSTAEAVIARAGAVGLGAVLVHHAFQDESTKSSW